MAKDLITKVGLLCSKFTPSMPPAKESRPDNGRASSSSSIKRNRENTRQRDESEIVGPPQRAEQLVAWLIDPEDDDPKNDDLNSRLIAVFGEPHCGKTALVRSVFSKPKIKHHFDRLAWACVTDVGVESDPMKNLLVDILKQIPLQDQAKNLEHMQAKQLLNMLHKSLMGLRYLIVLDNICEAGLINEFLRSLGDPKGSRIIVITPPSEVQKFADPWTLRLKLPPEMTDEESKKLLRVSITGDGDSESQKIYLEEEILKKCNGSLPQISLLGGLLSAVLKENWETLIKRLKFPTLDDVMRLSFDELPDLMKPCVLYMALFPKESEVLTRRLFRLWAAEGLVAGAAEGLVAEAAEESVQMPLAEDCFHELERRNLIRIVQRKLDGSARSCRMPAFLHKFFFDKAKEAKHLQILHSSDSVSEEESRGMDPVAERSTQNQQKQAQNKAAGYYGYQVQFLRSFTSFNTRKLGTQAREIKDLLKSTKLARGLGLLRVLDLEGVYKPVLPENFGNILCSLRYLGLRWTVLDSIPESVGNLLFLETLDLKHTNITKVTSAIWKAKNLQHLYLSGASFDESPRHDKSGSSPNPKLETLWGLFIGTADGHMINVLEKLRSLNKLGVTCHPKAVKKVGECILKLDKLKSLRLRSRDLSGQPLQTLRLRSRDLFRQPANLDLSSMTPAEPRSPKTLSLSNLYLIGSLKLRPVQEWSVHLKEIKVLTLSMSELECDPMEVLQCLNDLIVLKLLARSYAGQSLRCEKGFLKLRILKLWILGELDTLVVENDAMCNLEELDIRQCEKLKTVHGLCHINSLKIVSLTGVPKVLLEPGRIIVPRHTLVKTKELAPKKDGASKQ